MTTTIQQDIENTLQDAISNRAESFYIDELKFLKAELQRNKLKEVTDKEAIGILVSLYKSQLVVIKETGEDSAPAGVAYSLIANINDFLPESVIKELTMTESDIQEWIEDNVDVSKFKNIGMAIGFVKNTFKFTDGELIKNILIKTT